MTLGATKAERGLEFSDWIGSVNSVSGLGELCDDKDRSNGFGEDGVLEGADVFDLDGDGVAGLEVARGI